MLVLIRIVMKGGGYRRGEALTWEHVCGSSQDEVDGSSLVPRSMR